jgi:hypothetical protein
MCLFRILHVVPMPHPQPDPKALAQTQKFVVQLTLMEHPLIPNLDGLTCRRAFGKNHRTQQKIEHSPARRQCLSCAIN